MNAQDHQILIDTAIALLICIREQNPLVNPYEDAEDKRCALQIHAKATARLNTLPADIVATARGTFQCAANDA